MFPLFTCLGCNCVGLSNLFSPSNRLTSLCFDKQSNKGLHCHCGVKCVCHTHTNTHFRDCCQQPLKFKNHICILTARIMTSMKNLTSPKHVFVSCSCVYVYTVCIYKYCVSVCLESVCTMCIHTTAKANACLQQKSLSYIIYSNAYHVIHSGDNCTLTHSHAHIIISPQSAFTRTLQLNNPRRV